MTAKPSINNPGKQALDKVILVGNPNVGKSVIFNYLTGAYRVVSNYPGTTVEIYSGSAHYKTHKFNVLDTPGVNNLIPHSEDEKVTRDILLSEDNYSVVSVLDAKNLKRGLMITLQLVEMELPLMVAVNMLDEARSRGNSDPGKGLGRDFKGKGPADGGHPEERLGPDTPQPVPGPGVFFFFPIFTAHRGSHSPIAAADPASADQRSVTGLDAAFRG